MRNKFAFLGMAACAAMLSTAALAGSVVVTAGSGRGAAPVSIIARTGPPAAGIVGIKGSAPSAAVSPGAAMVSPAAPAAPVTVVKPAVTAPVASSPAAPNPPPVAAKPAIQMAKPASTAAAVSPGAFAAKPAIKSGDTNGPPPVNNGDTNGPPPTGCTNCPPSGAPVSSSSVANSNAVSSAIATNNLNNTNNIGVGASATGGNAKSMAAATGGTGVGVGVGGSVGDITVNVPPVGNNSGNRSTTLNAFVFVPNISVQQGTVVEEKRRVVYAPAPRLRSCPPHMHMTRKGCALRSYGDAGGNKAVASDKPPQGKPEMPASSVQKTKKPAAGLLSVSNKI